MFSRTVGRRLVGALLAIASIVAVLGLGQLKLNSHYSAYFDSDDDQLIAHQKVSALYSRDDSIFVVLMADRSFLSADHYTLLEDLTLRLAQEPTVSSIVSITELGIIGEAAAPNGSLVATRAQLIEDGRALGLLLSEDELTVGIQVQVGSLHQQADDVLKSVNSIRQAVSDSIADTSISAHYTGTLALNEAYIDVVRHDLARIFPLLIIATFGVAAWLLGSSRAAIIILPIGVISVLFAFGMAGLLDMELAAIHAFVPVIIISISMAGSMHLTLTYARMRSKIALAAAASRESVRANLLPLSLANGTTVLGFLSLAFSPSPPLRVVGYLVAIGVAMSFLLCNTLLPALLARTDPPGNVALGRFQKLPRLATVIEKRRPVIILAFLFVTLPASWFISRIEVGDNVLDYFVASHQFYRDTHLVDEHLSGVNEILYSVDSGTPYGIFRREAIEATARLDAWLAKQPEVKRVVSIAAAPAIREAQQEGRLQERLNFYRSRADELKRQNSLLHRVVSPDYSASVVTAYLQNLDSGRMIDFDDGVHHWAAENLRGYTIRSAGPTLMFASLGERNIRSMLIALTSALVLAAIVLGLALRSMRMACVAVVCNLLPILLVFSVWSLTVGQISLGAAVVLGMVLGILLDDTIYFLTAFHDAHHKGHANPVSSALRRIGPALLMTSIALVSGLSLGLTSDFGPIWSMSLLSATIISVALVVDLTLLPALLYSRRRRRTAT